MHNETPIDFGFWVNVTLVLVFGVFVLWQMWSAWKRQLALKPVKDGPESEAYKVYTREFDVEIRAHNLRQTLRDLSPDLAKGFFDRSEETFDQQCQSANSFLDECENLEEGLITQNPTVNFSNSAIHILVDQSGSMKGERIAWASAGIFMLANRLSDLGANVEVAGFTTAGWRGGFSRAKWEENNRPKRPGRLCATLYVIYKSFEDDRFRAENLYQMLDPNILRENIDGEAIEWAEKRLLDRPERSKILVLVSDGAPVDDSTLLENGPSYLERHLKKVVRRIETDGNIEIAGIGIVYDISLYYQNMQSAQTAIGLVEAGLLLAQEAHKRNQSNHSKPPSPT